MDAHANWWLLRLDIRNAFNEVERSAVFEALRRHHLGGMVPFLRLFYAQSTDLQFFGVEEPAVLLSQRGVR